MPKGNQMKLPVSILRAFELLLAVPLDETSERCQLADLAHTHDLTLREISTMFAEWHGF